jgi:uncharacterized membrane protein
VSAAGRIASAAIFALFALQLAWHGWLAPPLSVPAWAMALAFAAPLLPACVLALRGNRRAAFWGAFAAFFYFSHGVMDAYAAPEVRGLALAEAALDALLIVAASWDGLRARFRRKPATPPTV